jgi:hypothetical protein
MNVVDSSGWLEYFAEEPNAEFFAPAIEASVCLKYSSGSINNVGKMMRLRLWRL